MVSNIWFDVCAIFLMLVILYTHLLKKNLRLKQNILFLSMLAAVFFTAVSGLSGAYIENAAITGRSTGFNSIEIRSLLSYIYFICHILTPILYILYICSVLNVRRTRLYEYLMFYVPELISLLLLAITPITDGIFYYDNLGVYHRGNMIWVFYATAVYYVAYGLHLLYVYGKNIKRETSAAFASFAIFAFMGTVIQLKWPYLRVENFFNVLVLLMIYISIERPADLLDSQTGYSNSRAFNIYADICFQRHREINFVLVSIDNIPALEKQLGHEKSELLLIQAAQFFGRFVKQADIYRLEQGLFAIVMKNGREAAAENIIDLITERFREPFSTDNYNLILSECCCYISCPKDAENIDGMKRIIELASDAAFHRNRHSVRVYELDINGDNRRRGIDRILRSADIESLFDIKYQPVFNIAENRFTAAETQIAINTKEYGIITAKELMPVAEENGKLGELSVLAFEMVCSFIEEHHPSEYGIGLFEITLPVSELIKKDVADVITAITDRHHVPHHMIGFEVTEETIMSYQGTIEYNINALNDRGFTFTLDNYGNGYTDAGMLLRIPLHVVILDRRLTQAAITSKKADTMLVCTVEMLKRLGKIIKAERIETTKQEEYARQLGCDLLQGYHLSLSLSEDELVKFMKGGKENAL